MNRKVEIVAEIGSVHDGSIGNALKLIDLAADVGADCVKFQMHIADAETLIDAPEPPYFKGEGRFEYFQRTAFTFPQWRELKMAAETNGLKFLCSAFSVEALEILETLDVYAHKVASGEVTNIPLLQAMAATGKVVYMSSGMSSWKELDEAMAALIPVADVILMQCTSMYPCPLEKVGMNVMAEMQSRYDVAVGFSDHTMSINVPAFAVLQGARVVEKHLTYSRSMYGSDAAHSLEPNEFRQMVMAVREAEEILNEEVDKDAIAIVLADLKPIFEKSLVTVMPINAGTIISREMLAVKKPGGGIPPKDMKAVLGCKAKRELFANVILFPEDIEGGST